MLGLTFALGYDHLNDQIRVNALLPSGIATGMNEGRSRVAANAHSSVQGRPGQPMDIAHSVAFLLSD